MNLYLLKPRDDIKEESSPWEPRYDKAFGFVVRAGTETDARKLATTEGGDEICSEPTAWLDPEYSTCEALAYYIKGEEKIILQSSSAS